MGVNSVGSMGWVFYQCVVNGMVVLSVWGQWNGCVNSGGQWDGCVNSVGSMGWVFYQCGVNGMGV